MAGVSLLYRARRPAPTAFGSAQADPAAEATPPVAAAQSEQNGAPAPESLPPIAPEAAERARRAERDRRVKALQGSVRPGVAIASGVASDGYPERLAAARALPDDLSAREIELLMIFLDERFDARNALGLLEYNNVKNEILNVLGRQQSLAPGLGAFLAAAAVDERHDSVWRDYCIQHLQPYCKRRWAQGGPAPDDPDWPTIEEAYRRAAAERQTARAGTALLGMSLLAVERGLFARDRVAERALELAAAEDAAIEARVTALQVCARLKCAAAAPLARRLAGGRGPVMLRMSAIALLGDVGEARDLEDLAKLSASSESRLRTAAKSALRRLEKSLVNTKI